MIFLIIVRVRAHVRVRDRVIDLVPGLFRAGSNWPRESIA